MSPPEPRELELVGALPPGPWRLADSPWPRTACDRRNSRRVAIEGPTRAGLRRVSEHAGGLAVAADQSLRVSMSRRLVALEPEGALRWSVEIDGRGPQTDWAWHLPSTPLVLAEDHCVVTFGQSALFVSASGRMLARVHTHSMLDNSGPAPNLAPDGTLILTTMLGELLRLSETSLVELAAGFGYDLVAPAIDDEGRMALAGYAGKGLVLTEPSGAIVWRSGLRHADLVPSMDAEGRVACGSLNEERSRILDR